MFTYINSTQATEEKCILVSHYTSTLNVIEAYCKSKRYSYLRLDGCVVSGHSGLNRAKTPQSQTPVHKRQEYVDAFNKSSQKSNCTYLEMSDNIVIDTSLVLFLLSAKAGGVGLNLIGASRLCLIDSDWNPRYGTVLNLVLTYPSLTGNIL